MIHSGSQEKELTIDRIPLRRALLSVFDKTGLVDLAKALTTRGVILYSTGGTEKFLRDSDFDVRSVSELTRFPEMLDGRVKTLHPMVHGGLLYRRELTSHVEQAQEHGIEGIDLLVVNLYPFEATVAKPGATHQEIVEQIDIGGPAMLRSAAKNYRGVALLTDPSQYGGFITEFEAEQGTTSVPTRRALARDAFALVARYDQAISDYFVSSESENVRSLPSALKLDLPLAQHLRYGENPQQSAALYGAGFQKICTQLWGKELSYNNILDTSAALGLMNEFGMASETTPTVAAIIKHTNPCGVAEGASGLDAFERAFTTDPESPFGGIIIVNTVLDAALATRINAFFSEVILAPSFDADALEILKKKKDRRLLSYDPSQLQSTIATMQELRSVVGGVLHQEVDRELVANESSDSVTSRAVSELEKRGLQFVWKIVKHVKSNAIVYGGIEDGFARTLGIGGGQTSRVESSRIAVEHAKRHGLSLAGSLVASDAFFPFADGLIQASEAGAVAAIQPGGSVRDAEVITAAEERNMSMVLTGMRHFKH